MNTILFKSLVLSFFLSLFFSYSAYSQTQVNFAVTHLIVPEDTGTIMVEVQLSAALTAPWAIDVAPILSMSTGDCNDFDCLIPNFISFQTGITSSNRVISITLDAMPEPVEDIYFRLEEFVANPSIQIGPDSIFRLTIVDASIGASSVVRFQSEAIMVNEDTGTVEIAVVMNPPRSTSYSIDVVPVLSTSSADCNDFDCGIAQTITFAPGDTLVYRSVPIIMDGLPEPIENISFRLEDIGSDSAVLIGADSLFELNIDASTHINRIQATSFSMVAFPNPASSELSLRLYSDRSQQVKSQAINVLGTVVKEQMFTIPVGTALQPIDISGLPTGWYVITIQTRDDQLSQLIFIE